MSARVFLHTYLLVARRRLSERGVAWALGRALRRCFLELAWLTLLPLALVGHACGFRRLAVRIEHIGHLAVEPDCLLKEVRLGKLKPRHWLLLAPPGRVANDHLLSYWENHFSVIRNAAACALLDVLTRRWFMHQAVHRYVGSYFGSQAVYPINAEWGGRPPILALSRADRDWGEHQLAEIGIPPGQWFVAVHVREGGFLPHNEPIQSHRNASIEQAYAAMAEIVRRGGLCVRMGDPTMQRLAPLPGVIDYAHHPARSARLDVILCARARFFLGCTSGLAFLAAAFGVPVAHANMIPVETLGIRPGDLSIPKRVWSDAQGRYLRFDELLASPAGGYFFTHQYRAAGLTPHENSAEEIRELACEMLDRLTGTYVPSDSDEQLHRAYMRLFRPGHYSYGAASRVGLGFLRRHRELILPKFAKTGSVESLWAP